MGWGGFDSLLRRVRTLAGQTFALGKGLSDGVPVLCLWKPADSVLGSAPGPVFRSTAGLTYHLPAVLSSNPHHRVCDIGSC